MLKPCPSGEILYIEAGLSTSTYALSWVPFIGNRVTINSSLYSGIVWYVVGFCCHEEGQPDCKPFPESCLQNAIASIPINTVTQVGTGDCPTFKTNVCCVTLTNCDTKATMSAIMNDADISFWENLRQNQYSVYLDYYGINGQWLVDYICCNYDNPTYGQCGDNSCSINNFYIDPEVIGVNEVAGCYVYCYQLRPCNGGPNLNYIFDNDGELYQYIDTAITVEEIPNLIPAGTYYLSIYCSFYPSTQGPCCGYAEASLTITDSYTDCACFLGPEPVKYTRVIPKPDRHFYQVTQGQCDIDANIKFAEGYYRLFKELKHGIQNTCDNINFNKLWIKKNLSDLAVINDPTACTAVTPTPTVICPEPTNLK